MWQHRPPLTHQLRPLLGIPGRLGTSRMILSVEILSMGILSMGMIAHVQVCEEEASERLSTTAFNGRDGDPSPARSKGKAKRQQSSRKKSDGRAAKLNAAMSKRDKKITQQRKELARLRGGS